MVDRNSELKVFQTATKLYEFSRSHPVKILMGPEEEVYWLNTVLLCDMSPFFKKCIENTGFREAKENIIKMPEDCPQAFDIILRWVFTSEIADAVEHPEVLDYAKAYALADKLMMVRCKNNVLDCIRSYFQTDFCGSYLAYLPPHILEHDSLLRTFLVDQCAFDIHNHPKHQMDGGGKLVKGLEWCFGNGGELATDVIQKLLFYRCQGIEARGVLKDPAGDTQCAYHDHSGDAEFCGQSPNQTEVKDGNIVKRETVSS